MKLLLISNSTNAGEGYLDHCKHHIVNFLKENNARKILFIPFAAITFSFDEYLKKVENKLNPLGIKVNSIHNCSDIQKTVNDAQAIVTGGGNTFYLLKNMQKFNLIEMIRNRVLNGVPYIGWSAGANIACPTICTTNDMPVVEPDNFRALNLIPFQINPHYLDAHPDGHAGETREQRIQEYIAVNPDRYVAGLRESCMLLVDNNTVQLLGTRTLRIFKCNEITKEYKAGDKIDFLIK